jgi:hypothetical protein
MLFSANIFYNDILLCFKCIYTPNGQGNESFQSRNIYRNSFFDIFAKYLRRQCVSADAAGTARTTTQSNGAECAQLDALYLLSTHVQMYYAHGPNLQSDVVCSGFNTLHPR